MTISTTMADMAPAHQGFTGGAERGTTPASLPLSSPPPGAYPLNLCARAPRRMRPVRAGRRLARRPACAIGRE